MKPNPKRSIDSAIRRGLLLEEEAERLEDVGRPRGRAHRAVPVLRDRGACGGRDDRGGGGDVERAALRRRRFRRRRRRRRASAARGGRARASPRRSRRSRRPSLPSRAARSRNPAIWACVASPAMIPAITSRASSRLRLRPSAMSAIAWVITRGSSSPSRDRAGVRTLSGWNWTPSIGSSPCRTPMTSPSAVRDVTASTSGTRRRGERVVAADLDLRRQPFVDTAPVVGARRSPCRAGAPWPGPTSPPNASMIAWCPRQTPSVRVVGPERPDHLDRHPGVLGTARAG